MTSGRGGFVEGGGPVAAMTDANGGSGKSEREREKTKLRERRRRSITTKIIDGVKKHGGYRLPARPDINDVLRALAREAGFVVEPDGTTYRAAAAAAAAEPQMGWHVSRCNMAAAGGSSSGTPTPTGAGDDVAVAGNHVTGVGSHRLVNGNIAGFALSYQYADESAWLCDV